MSTKAERRARNEQLVGLANNASGAAFGVIGTKAVYDQQRGLNAARKLRDAGLPQKMPAAPKVTRLERGLKRIKAKPKYVLPALAATAVGGQLVNAGLDAQSAHYFGRELVRGSKKPKEAAVKNDQSIVDVYIAKSDLGAGRGSDLDVSKRQRRFDPEGDRQRRLGIYEGAGVAGALGLTAAGAYELQQRGLRRLARVNQPYAKGGAMLAGAGASAGLAALAHRRANSARNQRWT